MKDKLSIYRIVLMVLGALHLPLFFFGSYGHSTENELTKIADWLGYEDLEAFVPKHLSGFNMIRMINAAGEDRIGVYIALFAVPVVLGLVMLALAAMQKKAGYITAAALSAVMLFWYCFTSYVMHDNITDTKMGEYFSWNPLILILVIGIPVISMTVAIIGLASDKDPKEELTYSQRNFDSGLTAATLHQPYAAGGMYGNEAYRPGTMSRTRGTLIGVAGEYMGAEIPLESGVTLTIGRNSQTSNLVLKSPIISEVHCRVTFYGDRNIYGVIDLSKNGIYNARGMRLPKEQEMFMTPGDEITLGHHGDTFRFG